MAGEHTFGPKKSKEGRVILTSGILCLAVLFLIQWIERRESVQATRTFDAMTPNRHLAEAKNALRKGDLDTVLRHLNAIPPGAAESQEALAVRRELYSAQEAAQQQNELARKAEELKRQQENALILAIEQLRERLRELGYDVTVARSQDKQNEIIIGSADFGDTDHRVRFLAFIRGRNSPAVGVCAVGFQSVRLQSRPLAPILGFDESYPLNCLNLY